MNQMDLTNIYRTFHPNTKEYTSLTAPHGTFSKIYHIFGYKANCNRLKEIWKIPCILAEHHDLKLEFNNNTDYIKPTNSWKLNNAQLNHHWVKKEIKKKIKDFLEFSVKEMYNISKLMEHYESSAKRNVHSTNCPQKEFWEISY